MTIYYVSSAGNDSNNGTSTASPWKTISKVNSFAFVPGDNILFKCGDTWLAERLLIRRSGAAGQEILFKNYGTGSLPVIDGSGISGYSGGLVDINHCDYVILSGLSVINSTKNAIYVVSSSYVLVEGNYTYSSANSGVGIWNSDHIGVAKNKIEKANMTGSEENLSIANSSFVEVYENELYNGGPGTGGEGLNIKDGSHDVNVYKNSVHNNPKLAYGLDAWQNNTYNVNYYDNVAYSCKWGIIISSEQGGPVNNVRVYNNIAYNITEAAFAIPWWGGTKDGQKTNVSFEHNTAYKSRYGFWNQSPLNTNVAVRNNIFNQCTTPIQLVSGSESQFTIDHNFTTGDPKFVDPNAGNFKLQVDSPCIGVASDGKDLGVLFADSEEPSVEEPMATIVNLTGISSGNATTKTITITAVADQPALFEAIVVNYVSPNSTGSLSIAPKTGAQGNANITITVNNGEMENNLTSITFSVAVIPTPVLNPPTIDPVADIVIYS